MINDDFELENTRAKIRDLEAAYQRAETRPMGPNSDYVRELTLRSLRTTINSFTEEVVRYECSRRTVVSV